MDKERAIRERHKKLESVRSTLSAKIVNEVKSEAHRDRGELLLLVANLRMELAAKMDAVEALEEQLKQVTKELKSSKDDYRALQDFLSDMEEDGPATGAN